MLRVRKIMTAQGDQLGALHPPRGVGQGGWEGRETQEGRDMGTYVYV